MATAFNFLFLLSAIPFAIGVTLFAIFSIAVISKRNDPTDNDDVQSWILIFLIAACLMLIGIGIRIIPT